MRKFWNFFNFKGRVISKTISAPRYGDLEVCTNLIICHSVKEDVTSTIEKSNTELFDQSRAYKTLQKSKIF